jgi:multidrug efflux pump
VLALIGMIAKNSVILIDQIEQERRTGKPLGGRGGCQRLAPAPHHAHRPVHGSGAHPHRPHGLLGPMAFAIMGGLLVASLLTLVFLPTLYVTWGSLRGAKKEAAAAPV